MTLPSKQDKREHVYASDAFLTYEELKAHIEVMDEEQLKQNVTVHDKYSDEYEPVRSLEFAPETDVLDKNHPFLEIDG